MSQVSIPMPSAIGGVAGQFDTPGELLAAARRVHQAGFRRFDVYSPYPIHGMDLVMGLGRSHLGWIVAAAAAAGAVTALVLQWYTNVLDYPLITQGKPYFSWQAFLVVVFELSVLFAAFAAVFGMFALNGLPRWHHPTLTHDLFTTATDDGFFMLIEAADEKFAGQQTWALLQSCGASRIEWINES